MTVHTGQFSCPKSEPSDHNSAKVLKSLKRTKRLMITLTVFKHNRVPTPDTNVFPVSDGAKSKAITSPAWP